MNGTAHEKVNACHLKRNAYLYVRQSADRRQLLVPVVLPQTEMLPKNFARFCPKSDVDRDENLSTVRTFLQDTCAGW
jgi:hypothetical protein